MMDGVLKSKGSANVVWVLEKPDWMLQPTSEWSDEQKELAQQFQAEQKRLDDQRESRKQALEGEVVSHPYCKCRVGDKSIMPKHGCR